MSGKIPSPEEMEFAPFGALLCEPSEEEPEPLCRPDFQHVNPFRTPSYRWERARVLAKEGQEFSASTDDAETGKAYEYLIALKRRTADTQYKMLAVRMPAIHQAHEIHQQDGALRWVLEACLLTGQASEEIGWKLDLSAAVVDWYERLFFNVRDRLSASDWIVLQAIGKKAVHGCTKQDLNLILKLLGYFGGPLVLEMCLPHLLPEDAVAPVDRTQADAKLGQRVRHLVEAMCVPEDDEVRQLLPELEEKLEEVVEQEGTTPSSQLLREQLAHLLGGLQEGHASEEPEVDSEHGEPNQAHPGWLPESDEDLREKA